jgi:hypothetical protein
MYLLCIKLYYSATITLLNNGEGVLRIYSKNTNKNLTLLMGLHLEKPRTSIKHSVNSLNTIFALKIKQSQITFSFILHINVVK